MRGKGEGSVYRVPKDTNQPLKYWAASIELPTAENGDRRRKVIRSKDKKVLLAKMDELKTEKRRTGDLATRDRTLASWMEEWFYSIASKKIRPKTAETYRGLMDREIIPKLGTKRLSKLAAGDVRALGDGIVAKGLSPSTAAQVHRILSVALKYAVREGLVGRNVATLVDSPLRAVPQLQALTVPESIQVLRVAQSDRLASLWSAVLLTGARQGELLGLELDRVLDGYLDLSWQLQRISWLHGCTPPCGKARGAECPDRRISVPVNFEHRSIAGGLYWTRPKSNAGWRVVPLVDPLRAMVEERVQAVSIESNPHGLLWTSTTGGPIDPRAASEGWDALLKRAGVPDVRFHDGRHTTVDLLSAAGVPIDVIMEIVGHSTRAMTIAYRTRGDRVRMGQAMLSLSRLISSPDDPGTPPAVDA